MSDTRKDGVVAACFHPTLFSRMISFSLLSTRSRCHDHLHKKPPNSHSRSAFRRLAGPSCMLRLPAPLRPVKHGSGPSDRNDGNVRWTKSSKEDLDADGAGQRAKGKHDIFGQKTFLLSSRSSKTAWMTSSPNEPRNKLKDTPICSCFHAFLRLVCFLLSLVFSYSHRI